MKPRRVLDRFLFCVMTAAFLSVLVASFAWTVRGARLVISTDAVALVTRPLVNPDLEFRTLLSEDLRPDPTPPAAAPPPVVPATPILKPATPLPAPTAPAAPVTGTSNWLEVAAVGLSVPLGSYNDCGGAAQVPPGAARDWCAYNPVVYFVGHNPGVFAPLVRAQQGNEVRYWDTAGRVFAYRITAIDRVPRSQAAAFMMDISRPHLVIQTCAVDDGSMDWMLVADPV